MRLAFGCKTNWLGNREQTQWSMTLNNTIHSLVGLADSKTHFFVLNFAILLSFHIICTHLTPRARPLVPPRPLPMPVPLLPVCDVPRLPPDKLFDPPATYPVPLIPPLPVPLPLPLVPLAPRTEVPACRCLSSSSALRLASSRRLSSSAALLSACCAFNTISFSISATSWLAPCQLGFRISR